MQFLHLMSIPQRYMEILNPSTSEQIIKLGTLLKLKEGDRVIIEIEGIGRLENDVVVV